MAPPVVFTAWGSADFTLMQDRVYYDIPAGPLTGWDKEVSGPHESAKSLGQVSGSTLEVQLSARDRGISGHWNDRGTASQTEVSVYVRDDLGNAVPFTLNYSESFSVDATGTRVRWWGYLLSADTQWTTMALAESASTEYSTYATSQTTFDEFPGVTYRLAFRAGWTADVETAYAVPNEGQTGSASGSISISAQIDLGDKPLVEIEAPAKASKGESVRLDAFAWDPDNGPKADGNGILVYQWDITSPSGERIVRNTTDILDHVFHDIGQYKVFLTVFDDEGMKASSQHNISVEAGVDLIPLSVVARSNGQVINSLFAPVNWPLSLSATVHNAGVADAPPSTATFYVSRDNVIGDEGDIIIASIPVPTIYSKTTETITLVVPGGLEALINLPGIGYSNWHGNINIGVKIDSAETIAEQSESNNVTFTTIALVDGVPARQTAVDNLSRRQAERWLTQNGFTKTPWLTRELPRLLPGFEGGDDGWYKPLPATTTFVSPFDGIGRNGLWYRQQAQIRKDENHPGRFKIEIQGTNTFGEPDPWMALTHFDTRPRWLKYVADWHNSLS